MQLGKLSGAIDKPAASVPAPWVPPAEAMPSARRRKFNYRSQVLRLTVGVVATGAGGVLAAVYGQPANLAGFFLFLPLVLVGLCGFVAAARVLAARCRGVLRSAGESVAAGLCVAEWIAIQIWFGVG